MRVWFQKCDCGIFHEPHGRFYDEAKGRCPTATLTMESGEVALKGIAELRGLSAEETEAIRAQLQAAGLRGRCGSDEYVAALLVYEFFK